MIHRFRDDSIEFEGDEADFIPSIEQLEAEERMLDEYVQYVRDLQSDEPFRRWN